MVHQRCRTSTYRAFQRAVIATAALVVIGCTSTIQEGSHCTVEPGFLDSAATYSWLSDNAITVHDETGYISPAIVAALRDRVVTDLAAKGFVLSDPTAQADALQIQLTLRVRREIVAVSRDDRMDGCRFPDCIQSPTDPGNWIFTKTIGFLSADAYFDEEPIWRGWVEQELFPADRDRADAVLSEAVPRLLNAFPP